MSDGTLLGVDDLGVRVGNRWLLQGISFSLQPGESLTLVGESGAGKSLLAQAVMGNLSPALRASGRVTVAGTTSLAGDAQARRVFWGRGIALLPQEPSLALDPLRPIAPQLAEVHALVRGASWAQARAAAVSDLAGVGLARAASQYPWQVSGGMAQRAAATVARAGGAKVLIVDEPTKGLDAHWCDRIVKMMREVLHEGGCVVCITHDLRVAQALGGRLVVLREGQVVEEGDAAQVLDAPSHAFTRRLIAAMPARWPRRTAPSRGAPLLQALGLGKGYGGRALFENLDLRIHAGERLVLQGPSGSGKSTLGNVLLGLVAPDAGEIRREPTLGPQGCQKLYQDPVGSFAEHVTLGQSLRDVVRRHRSDWRAVEDLLARLRVPGELLERRPGAVSGGELQRVALARVVAVRPQVLFADEPTSRLDLITQQEALSALMDAADDAGAALLLVTHDEEMADAIGAQSLQFGCANTTDQRAQPL